MSTKKIFVAGFGGQGVLLIGQMLSYAAMYEGKEVTWMPSYGPEMRGGTANCTVCISDKPITSPLVTSCDVLVAMNGPSLDKFEDMLVPGGHLFVNASVINYKARRTDVKVHYVDCNKIAEHEVGNAKTANMVMLGAIIRASQVVSLDIMDQVLAKTMTGKKEKLIPANKQALSAWKE
ncbi:MAG: 2-oxoacid:ferredoxin oxidoreductase subunit gamma [Clostridiales bacterium]|nr:2-oxoacid:ferredoxin oxidoreductase subunit gamma [Clostridiales bacterium]